AGGQRGTPDGELLVPGLPLLSHEELDDASQEGLRVLRPRSPSRRLNDERRVGRGHRLHAAAGEEDDGLGIAGGAELVSRAEREEWLRGDPGALARPADADVRGADAELGEDGRGLGRPGRAGQDQRAQQRPEPGSRQACQHAHLEPPVLDWPSAWSCTSSYTRSGSARPLTGISPRYRVSARSPTAARASSVRRSVVPRSLFRPSRRAVTLTASPITVYLTRS